jgi:hypothetical protein
MKRGYRYSHKHLRKGAEINPLFVPPTVPGRHPSELLRAEDVEVSKIVAVMVCVDFSDYLEQTLTLNSKLVDEIIVVTSSKDLATRNICEKYSNVTTIVTECFYENGCTFNKGKALNKALATIPHHVGTWVLITDADIVLPLNFKEYFKPRRLNTAVLYGAPRHFAYNRETYDKFTASGSRNYSLLDAYYSPGNMPIGYFQFFSSLNLKRRGLTSPSAYPEGHDDASYSDLVFCKKFSTRTTLKQLHVIHLGVAGINHRGRISPLFKKTAPEKSLSELYPNTTAADLGSAHKYSQGPLVALQNKLAPATFDLSSIVHPGATKSKDLAVMCCYFSSVRFKNPVDNYYIFKKFIEQHVDLYTIELVFDGEEPQLGKDSFYKKTIRGSRADNLLWQKERLLNILAEDILDKTDYKYLGWADADVLFQNENWDKSVCDVLEENLVAQMFDSAALLSPDLTIKEIPEEYFGLPQRYLSTIKAWEAEGASTSDPINLAGPPATQCGFAWASCREFFETIGLEDRNAFGDSDSCMIAAFTGGEPFFNVHQMHCMGPSTVSEFTAYKQKIRDLASSLNKKVLSCSDGSLYHLQHGSLKGKQYCSRLDMIKEAKYDALKHIELDENGLWKISAAASPLLKKHLTKYFNDREEDQFLNNYDALASYEV